MLGLGQSRGNTAQPTARRRLVTAVRGLVAARRNLTVRRRLVAGLLALLAVVLTATGVTETLVLRHALYQRSAQSLRTELALLVAAAPLSVAGGPGAPGSGGTTTGAAKSCPSFAPGPPPGPLVGGPDGRGRGGPTLGPDRAAALAQVLAERGVASAVVGSNGQMLACATAAPTGSSRAFTVPSSAATALAARRYSGYVAVDAEGRHLLAIAQPVGADTAILVTDLADDDAAVGVVALITVLAGLAALMLAGLLSRPLLRSGLAPLRTVALTADAVAAGDLDRRADLPHSPDEVGRLGGAFDAMVDRLQAILAERDQLVGELAAREATMRRFLADASHELRTPITAIRGGAQVLRMGAGTDPGLVDESLGHIQTQAERMSRLVADLLFLSRHDSIGRATRRQLIDLGSLVRTERAHWEALCTGHPLTVVAGEAWVEADSDALVRLCANLVDNAATYSPPGTVLSITVRSGAGRAQLIVSDHGPGIAPADRARIFERFYRGDPARARATGGSGLGLAIVAGIAADHGGTVWIEETPGGGATVVVEVPTVPPPTDGPARSSVTGGGRDPGG